MRRQGRKRFEIKEKNKCCQHEDENTILRKIDIMNKVETIIKVEWEKGWETYDYVNKSDNFEEKWSRIRSWDHEYFQYWIMIRIYVCEKWILIIILWVYIMLNITGVLHIWPEYKWLITEESDCILNILIWNDTILQNGYVQDMMNWI